MDAQEAKWLEDRVLLMSVAHGLAARVVHIDDAKEFAAAHSAQVEAERDAVQKKYAEMYRQWADITDAATRCEAVESELGDITEALKGEESYDGNRATAIESLKAQRDCYKERAEAAEAELVKLRDWKDSAMQVLAEWEKVADFAAENGALRLGHSKAAESLRVMGEVLRWIPVEERLPESEGRYLIVYQQLRTRRAFIGDYIPQESRWTCVMNDMRVTHWREIGELPGEALGETGPTND
jgi:prefoldin subunit 5